MSCIILPGWLKHTIDARLDAALVACPEAKKDREALFKQLVWYFDRHGHLPDFTIEKSCDSTQNLAPFKHG